MVSRYNIARAQGRDFFQRVFDEDKKLLDSFGIGLLSVDSAVRVYVKKKIRGDKINVWDVTEIGPSTWEWLHPLLQELALYRLERANRSAFHAAQDVQSAQAAK